MTSQLDLDAALDLDPEDPEAFEAVRETLLDRFGEWMEAGQRPGVEWAVAEALRFKADSLDGRVGRWRAGDLDEILTEWFPRKIWADEADVALVCPTLRAFFTWLDRAGLLAGDGDSLPALLATLDRIEPGLAAAMADESRFGMGKSMTAAMLADGVDLDDDGAVQEWIAGFNHVAAAQSRPCCTLPPVAVPDEETLARLAAAAPAMVRLATLVAWVGDGRRLTGAGNLGLRDARELAGLLDPDVPAEVLASLRSSAHLIPVELAFRWALAAGFLEVDGPTVVPGNAADLLTTAPFDAWRQAIIALLAMGVTSAGMTGWVPFWAELLDKIAGVLLAGLHTHGPASPDDLADEALAEIEGSFDLSDVTALQHTTMAKALPGSVRLLVDRLAQAGAVQVTGDQVELAALGRWFVRDLLRRGGLEVPDLTEIDAAGLFTACRHWDAAVVDSALEGWVASREPVAAAEALAAVAGGTDDAETRLMAFAALECVGPAAEPAVRRLRDHPACRAYAAMWLIERGFEEPRPLDAHDYVAFLVNKLGLLLASSGPQAMAEAFVAAMPADGQHALVAELWRHDDATVPLILDALAAHGPKPVAKAAAKARFKHRTAAPCRQAT
ncbi:MAG TPA: hypothetical protein VM324_01920 [Egibacteraceae bacterium]|nr:hypothetical protein [Egibacteraceae bacterium]